MKVLQSDVHDRIIEIVAEYGYITVDEACLVVNDYKKAYNVLQYMTVKGTLGTFPTYLHPSKAYYMPVDMRRIIESTGAVKYVENFFPSSYRPSGFFHHANTIRVRLIIQNILGNRLIDFISEFRLKKQLDMRKICDGEFIFSNLKGIQRHVGIEVELTLKNADARRRRIRNLSHYAGQKLNAVMVFYNREIIKNRFKETMKKYWTNQVPVFFIYLEDFFKLKADVDAEDIDNNRIKIFQE
ncbi:MAG: hypothetical protein JW983_09935 [Elusimicrobia bacterium]|nr:hypothetical protein [Elusimicrobiota bacterium]